LASRATVIVVVIVSQLIYGFLGIFGAARHGLATSGNILGNEWLPVRAQVGYPPPLFPTFPVTGCLQLPHIPRFLEPHVLF